MSAVIRGPAGNNDCRIYVGNLPPDIREKDIEDMFYKFGHIADIDLKNKRTPGPGGGYGTPFAFVEFYDKRDADDAVMARDGYNYDGYRIRVETPRGGRGGFRGGFSRGGGRGGGGGSDRPRGPPPRRSHYKCIVSGLPSTGSWQDLKDHMREAGDVCYADVYRDGTGVVEFLRAEDMKYAAKQLDDTKFRSHEGDVAYIRVKIDPSSGGHSRSRSPSPYGRGGGRGYSRSRSRSPRGWGGPSGSGSRGRRRSRSFSRSRSRSSRSGSRSRSRSRTR